MQILLVLVVLVAAAGLVIALTGDPEKRARFLRAVALGFAGVATLFVGLFVVGETFTDPGGWRALLLVLAWLVPLVVLAAVAWYRPALAVPVLGAATLVSLAVAVWDAVDPNGWRSFEDTAGPVRGLLVFAVLAPTALLGWRRPLTGGVLLLVQSAVPLLLAGLAGEGGFGHVGSVQGLAAPALITGILFLLAAAAGWRRRPATGGPGPRPGAGDSTVMPPVRPRQSV